MIFTKKSKVSTMSRGYTAFTLAEVLITLGIIGVVAALTIPTLVQNANERATVVAVKKVYSTLSQAYTLAVQENGPPNTWDLSQPGNLIKILAPYLNVSKTCFPQTIASHDCMPDDVYQALNGADRYGNIARNYAYYSLSLANGVGIVEMATHNGCSGSGIYSCGFLIFSISNKKGRDNLLGKDHFQIGLMTNGFFFDAYNGYDSYIKQYCDPKYVGGANYQGATCATYMLRSDNADYLHQ